MSDELDKAISEAMSIHSKGQRLGCVKAGYKCIYVDIIKSFTRSTRNANLICRICNRKRNEKKD